MNYSTKLTLLVCIFGAIVTGCSNSSITLAPSRDPISTLTDPYWPSDGWRTSTPEEQGLDSQKLAEMLATIQKRKMNIHSFLIIRNGYLVSETYFGGYTQEMHHDLQSVGRSFTATLIGIAIDKGYIDGVDQPILDFFPDRTFENLDQQKEAITIEDVLTMRTGLEGLVEDPKYMEMQQSHDWVEFLLDRRVVSQPGSLWNYCSGCSHLLTAILQETTGINPLDFAEQYLFEPLGISGIRWMTDPTGIPYGAGGFELTPRDMAKLGYLYLRHGQWDGQQIVSANWVEMATQRYAGIDEHFGYGYHWFTVTSMEGYAALGTGGQIILVIPKSDLVIVTTAKTEESIFELIEQYIIPAVQNPR